MDEKKKSEASGDEPERLGLYVIEEQVEQSHDSQGECYLATHETSGDTDLLRKHTAEERAARGKSWRVQLECWASEGYSVLHAQFTEWARAQDRQSAESLLLTLEAVLEEVQRMLRAVSGPPKPRIRWRGVVGAAAVCALLFALVHPTSESPPPRGSEPLADPPPLLTSDDAQESAGTPDDPFASGALVDTSDAGDSVLARPLPREPFKGQKRPPCTRYAEVELIGACWTPHELKAPCPDVLYEHQGKCYVPNFSAKPPPQSLGQ